MKRTLTSAIHRLLSEFLVHTLLKRARVYRTVYPQMAVFAHDIIGTEIKVYGRFEDRELTALVDIIARIDRSKLVLDVGANVGNHTLFFVQQGFERVHAFEPNPQTSRLLMFNTEIHPQVRVHPYGLSARDAMLEAIVPLTNVGGASLQKQHQDTHSSAVESVMFEIKRFDDLPIASEPVGLLKIDVEGHEPEAIAGMRTMLERDGPLVLFECNRKTDPSSTDHMLTSLRELGYNYFASLESPESVISQRLPTGLRRPLRIVERMLSHRRLAACELRPIQEFALRNYRMIVASRTGFL